MNPVTASLKVNVKTTSPPAMFATLGSSSVIVTVGAVVSTACTAWVGSSTRDHVSSSSGADGPPSVRPSKRIRRLPCGVVTGRREALQTTEGNRKYALPPLGEPAPGGEGGGQAYGDAPGQLQLPM